MDGEVRLDTKRLRRMQARKHGRGFRGAIGNWSGRRHQCRVQGLNEGNRGRGQNKGTIVDRVALNLQVIASCAELRAS